MADEDLALHVDAIVTGDKGEHLARDELAIRLRFAKRRLPPRHVRAVIVLARRGGRVVAAAAVHPAIAVGVRQADHHDFFHPRMLVQALRDIAHDGERVIGVHDEQHRIALVALPIGIGQGDI
ncbi:hypothetical protein D3C72_1842830 [compost metagenome]